MYRTIIVPLDGSARSQRALPVAVRLANECGASLELARVHIADRPDLADDPSWDQMLIEAEQRYLDALALAYEDVAGGVVATTILQPPVVDSLAQLAGNRAAPLIVMAARGRVGLRRALLGSVSDGLVRAGAAPVLILRDRPHDEDIPSWRMRERPFRRIAVPLDGTPFAEECLAHALTIASKTHGNLHLIRVVAPPKSALVAGALAMYPGPAVDEVAVTRNDVAHEYLQGVTDRINAGGRTLPVTTEVRLSSNPAAAITESCRRHSIDLIVMATHGRGPSRLVFGSVGDRVLREGPDAILFVRPNGDRLPAGLQVGSKARASVPGPAPTGVAS